MPKFYQSSNFNFKYAIPCVLAGFTALFLILSAHFSVAQTWHTVRWVNDGDTIVLNSGQRVRYIGIDAPEVAHDDQKPQPYAYKARSYNKNLVMTKKVRLEYDAERHDRYGRVLAYVFLEDGNLLNERLLQVGLAYFLYRKPNVRYNNIFLKAQHEAMRTKKGIWNHWKDDGRKYIGNRSSQRFHVSSCPLAKKIKSNNKVQFSGKWEGFWKGYAPSKKCIGKFWSYADGTWSSGAGQKR